MPIASSQELEQIIMDEISVSGIVSSGQAAYQENEQTFDNASQEVSQLSNQYMDQYGNGNSGSVETPLLTATQTSIQEGTISGVDETIEQIGLQHINQVSSNGMQSQQQATQMAFGGTVDQTILDLAKQIAKNPDDYLDTTQVVVEEQQETGTVTTQDVQDVVVKIVSNANEQGVQDIAELVGQLADGAKTSEEVVTSLENLAALQQAGQTGDVDYVVEQIGTQIALGKNINQVLVQVSTEVINNYFTHEINKDLTGAEYGESDIQQIIKDIANSAQAQEGMDIDQIIKQLSDEVANNPEGELAYSIYNLAALKASGNSYEVSYAVSQLGTQVQVGENINQALIQVSAKIVNNYFADLNNDGTIKDDEKEIQNLILKIATSTAIASEEA